MHRNVQFICAIQINVLLLSLFISEWFLGSAVPSEVFLQVDEHPEPTDNVPSEESEDQQWSAAKIRKVTKTTK